MRICNVFTDFTEFGFDAENVEDHPYRHNCGRFYLPPINRFFVVVIPDKRNRWRKHILGISVRIIPQNFIENSQYFLRKTLECWSAKLLKIEATGFPNRRLPEYRFASTSAAAEQNVTVRDFRPAIQRIEQLRTKFPGEKPLMRVERILVW